MRSDWPPTSEPCGEKSQENGAAVMTHSVREPRTTAADFSPAGGEALNTTRDLPAIECGQETNAIDGASRARRGGW